MLTTILILAVGMAPLDWYTFEPEGKNYRVDLPTKPGDTSTRTVNNAAGGSQLTSAQLKMPDGVYLLQVTESRGKVDPKTLDEGIKQFAASNNAMLGPVTTITVDGNPGRDFEMTEPSDRGLTPSKRRWVVSGNSLFMLTAAARPGQSIPANADRFLGSLEIGSAKRADRIPATVATPAPAPARVETPDPVTVVETDDPETTGKEADAGMDKAESADKGVDKDKPKDAPKASAPARKPNVPVKITVSRISRNAKSYPSEDLQDLPRSFRTDSESFRDLGPAGSVLVGVRVTYIEHFGGPKVRSVQPIYRSGKNHYVGLIHGEVVGPVTTVVAKPGYAVGGLVTHTGLTVDGFRMVFMKIDGNRLDPNDSYNSPWLGDLKGGGPGEVYSPGALVVGLQGRSRNEVFALGLTTLVETKARDADSSASADEPEDTGPARTLTGPGGITLSPIPRNAKRYADDDLQDVSRSFANDRESFRDIGPAGSILVGVRVSYIDKGGPKIRSAQPIYRSGKTYYVGQVHGEVVGPVTAVVAKPGYAVGGLNTHTGLTVDGFRMVFMKVDGKRLDPNDSYNSPWLGDLKGGGPGEVTSQGEVVVGLQGRSRNEVFALGLTALR